MPTPKPKAGVVVWIACAVKPGPFSNERLVRVESVEGDPWVGFVDVRYLEHPVEQGETKIQARVLSVEDDTIKISLPGNSVAPSRVIQADKQQVSFASVPA
jgi:hypothetical protein